MDFSSVYVDLKQILVRRVVWLEVPVGMVAVVGLCLELLRASVTFSK